MGMFVFPAFDKNYKTRKRVFRCCERCRVRRIKCSISDKQNTGCLGCIKCGEVCSLIANVFSAGKSKADTPASSGNSRHSKAASQASLTGSNAVFLAVTSGSHAAPHSTPASDMFNVDVKLVTPTFLKQTFNFVVSGKLEQRSYDYVYHDHPKVVINNKTSDLSYWHESGIHVGYSSTRPISEDPPTQHALPQDPKQHQLQQKMQQSRSTVQRNVLQTDVPLYHIRDRRTYQYLIAIDAFSLTSGEYSFTNEEIKLLLEMYFRKVNSILPIINAGDFWDEYHSNRLPSILKYAILIVILKDVQAQPILRQMYKRNGKPTDDVQVYLDFINDLDNKIRQLLLVLPQLGDFDKIVHLITKLLMSIHYGYGRLGNEQASHDLTDAINFALLMGIHMKRQITEFNEEKLSRLSDLWWTCYILDRFNAFINSRCIFIRLKDFNIDPPKNVHLLKLIQISNSLEYMLLDIYRPFKRDRVKVRSQLYDLDEFQKTEFDLCEAEQKASALKEQKEELAGEGEAATGSVESYVESSVYLLTRLVNNVVILAGQKSKFDNHHIPNSIPEEIAQRASKNILWYIKRKPEDQVLNVPMIPWSISLGMAVMLKKKAKEILFNSNPLVSTSELLKQYIEMLERYNTQWWVVDEICKLTREFDEKLEMKKNYLKRASDCKLAHPNKRLQKDSVSNVVDTVTAKNAYNVDIEIKSQVAQPFPTPNISVPPNFPQISNLLNHPLPTAHVAELPSPNTDPTIATMDTNFSLRSQYSFSKFQDINTDSFVDYFGSVQIDLFDNEVLMDLPSLLMSSFESDKSNTGPPENQ